MRPRLRWVLVAGCALVLGLEAPAALAVLRRPAAPSTPPGPEGAAPEASGLDAGLELPRG